MIQYGFSSEICLFNNPPGPNGPRNAKSNADFEYIMKVKAQQMWRVHKSKQSIKQINKMRFSNIY